MTRIHRLSVLVAAIVACGITPARGQIVVRDPCFYRRDDCDRQEEAQRRARERALEAQERARERSLEAQERARERAMEAQERSRETLERNREHMLEAQQRTREAQERARERSLEAQERVRRMTRDWGRDIEQQVRAALRQAELHDAQLERAAAARDRTFDRARQAPGRDGYIEYPPGVRRRWP